MTDQKQSTATAPSLDARRRWHFGECVLDERTLQLLVHGLDAELERKPLEVLIYLLQHAGEVCTKDELLAAIWPGRVLSETVLTKCIGRLRGVLDDDDQEIIKTAYGFGYRFVAAVRVEIAPAPEPTRFNLLAGMNVPTRPLWTLIERLGTGGYGEAWRARHAKTNEQRVFKFALEESALVALKREITLFRVINETLGETARVVKLLDWNLERAPYFIETEFIPGGNLVTWSTLCGGLARMPLSDRLEMVAKIAEALAAVHSVGVLHKDLKPSNILVKPGAGGPADIFLADFGSGGVLDADRLEQLGITRLGFTKTVSSLNTNSGTPLYLAPEVLAGQPFTVKSDIYALGVILFQTVAGDFRRVMSPGWERAIEDGLLREDIALMAEGNPAERLSDAQMLARRLRSLGERRNRLIAEREAFAEAERTQRLLERTRARRFGLVLAVIILLMGTVLSTALYLQARRAQARTAIAAAESRAVTEFLSKDVFAPVSSDTESVKGMTVLQLLRRAGDEIDRRFSEQPAIASELHFVMGRSFQSFLDASLAMRHFNLAMDLGEHLDGQGSRSAMRSASALISIDYSLGQLSQHLARYDAVLEAGERRFEGSTREVLDLRVNVARGHYLVGDWLRSAEMFRSLLMDATRASEGHMELVGRANFYYGQLLTDLAQPGLAKTNLQEAISQLTLGLGETHAMVAEARSALGRALADSGRFKEAHEELEKAHELSLIWAPPPSWTEVRPRYFTALLFLHEDQPEKAESILAGIVSLEEAGEEAYLRAHKDSTPELDHTGQVRQALGEAYARQGKLPEAVATLQRAVSVIERVDGPLHPSAISAQLSLVEALIASGRLEESHVVFATVPRTRLVNLPSVHPIVAQWHRANGLLALSNGQVEEARTSLQLVRDIYQSLYGEHHWRVIRAQRELRSAGLSKQT